MDCAYKLFFPKVLKTRCPIAAKKRACRAAPPNDMVGKVRSDNNGVFSMKNFNFPPKAQYFCKVKPAAKH